MFVSGCAVVYTPAGSGVGSCGPDVGGCCWYVYEPPDGRCVRPWSAGFSRSVHPAAVMVLVAAAVSFPLPPEEFLPMK